MELVIVILITTIVLWKNGYTFNLIFKYYKSRDMKQVLINIGFLLDYLIYYYFLYRAAADRIESPLSGPLWLIVTFVILTICNILYDLGILKI